MAPRRVASREASSIPESQSRTRGAIRKNTRQRQPPNRYGAQLEPSTSRAESERTLAASTSSSSHEAQPSTPQYSHSPSSNQGAERPAPPVHSATRTETRTPTSTILPDSSPISIQAPESPINLETMRELLRSQQQEIVDQVLHQISSQNTAQTPSSRHARVHQYDAPNPPNPEENPTLVRIAELEGQIAQLRGDIVREPMAHPERRAPSTYHPTPFSIELGGESASTLADAVEVLFPGVERSTLVQIIENRFKPTNIYRLLASEKDLAESQRTISIGGVEFEQAERDGRESEYRMGGFFKAWAAYTGILVQLAPHSLQGELATALSIYTMNLYDLLEKYAWEAVKSYHFQFHRKRVASGKNIYQPAEWRQLDSELVASKCFAHPAPRPTWLQGQKTTVPAARRIYELPIRDNHTASGYPSSAATPSNPLTSLERRISQHNPQSTSTFPSSLGTGASTLTTQTCRNWNFRECRSVVCRYHHCCVSCGGNHRVSQCTTGGSGPVYQSRNGPHGR